MFHRFHVTASSAVCLSSPNSCSSSMPLWTSRWPTTNTLMVVLKTAQTVLQHVPQGPLQASFQAGWHSPVAPYLLFSLFSGQSADMMDGTGASISDHKVPLRLDVTHGGLPRPKQPWVKGDFLEPYLPWTPHLQVFIWWKRQLQSYLCHCCSVHIL